MKIQKKSSGGGEAWLATYSDMVTLLMCFFVLLYSMSSIDSAKWEEIVKSFNPKADKVSQIVTGEVTPGKDDVGAEGTSGKEEKIESVEQLYDEMKKFLAETQLTDDVQLFLGDGYIFITFKNKIFFDGNSSELRQAYTPVLDFLADGIKKIKKDVSEIKVFGHTNQADPDQPNAVEVDRDLSALRASKVVSYLQAKKAIDPKKISGVGFGQWYPVAPYDTMENREKNRRVEILISKNGSVSLTLDQIYSKMEAAGKR